MDNMDLKNNFDVPIIDTIIVVIINVVTINLSAYHSELKIKKIINVDY